jgi:hypothetical protein
MARRSSRSRSSTTVWRTPSPVSPNSGRGLAEVNGGPGALYLDGRQRLIGVVALDIAGGQIASISSIVNPDKLKHLGPVGDFASLLKPPRP